MKKHAILYLRQSKAKDDSISLEIQEREGRAHCTRHGYIVSGTVIDEDVSGTGKWQKRPNFPLILDMAVDVVVVYRWSRLSRRRADQFALIELLEEAGKTVESAVEPFDITTAGGRFARDQMLGMAAFEADLKSEQWKEALNRRAANGLPKNGLPRFGYMKDGKSYVQDPNTAPVLREMFIRYTKGAGFQALVKDLNERGVVTTRGAAWGIHSLIRTLDSGWGAGLISEKSKGTFYDGVHEPVITNAEWKAYVRAREVRKKGPHKTASPKWFLSGLVKCGLCGGVMFVNSYTETKSQVICSAYKNQRSCSGMWINRTVVEKKVAFWIGAHIDEVAALAYDDETRSDERAKIEARVSVAEGSVANIDKRLAKLMTAWSGDMLDQVAFNIARDEARAEREAWMKDLSEALDELALLAPVDQDVYERLQAGSTGMTPGEWGFLLGRVIRRVEVHKAFLLIVPVVGDAVQIPRR
ncbi:recombinase family protein [Nocardioides sp. WS12]|uniref:recombinase family protein n=1 Tax=Nocardioides sp. WS12 TaxID=2486272 RepID=UPI0015FAE52A|nr:recombinase family protein [Nocardioides sp. WS12]